MNTATYLVKELQEFKYIDEVETMLRPILRQGIGLLSSRRATGKLLVLTYHRVLETYDAIINEIDAVQFTQQMETLVEYFNVIPLAEGVERLQAGTLAAGSVCVTFDDGYRDNFDVALPILQALGLPATFFCGDRVLGKRHHVERCDY